MPALKSPSVIVLDNASYHNIKTEETVVIKINYYWGNLTPINAILFPILLFYFSVLWNFV
jgi:hypothetical protein